jgi:pectinesterase inhibitor-like protein
VQKLLKKRKLRPREADAIKECVETMKDSVDELQKSMLAMSDLEGPDFDMEMSNIQTWVSAALTDEDTCMDDSEENSIDGKVKDTIRSYIVTVAQLTSIALALINSIH